MKVFIDPPNSMILHDLVERFGHEPLSAMAAIQERIDKVEVDMPPMNVTLDDVVKGLKYAGIEVPSGVRGRLAVWGPLIEQADAAIVMDEAPFAFGCVGCERSNLMIKYLIQRNKIPVVHVTYPENEEQGKLVVAKIKEFLDRLDGSNKKSVEEAPVEKKAEKKAPAKKTAKKVKK